jgi:glutamate racemase
MNIPDRKPSNRVNEAKPIGIFDSGIGGLTVLKEIIRELPNESTIYLGDTARVPYGIRSPETVTRYAFENSRFLISKDIKLLVIACNTASSVSLEIIKRSVEIPVVGVIEPGSKAAVSCTHKKKIGVIGTDATIRSNSYTKAIQDFDREVEIYGLPCPLFVPLVEEGWTEEPLTVMAAEKYLSPIKDKGIDTLVLGCTHYPLLKNVLSSIMGSTVRLIDSAIETAKEIRAILSAGSLLNSGTGKTTYEYYVTDSPEKFISVGERFLGEQIKDIKKIELNMEV